MDDLGHTNVLFTTLDCCRYDSIEMAHMPFLKRLGNARKAYTHGTYTFPAHLSFFMGYLPSINEAPFENYYASEIKQLWRMKSGRLRDPLTIGLHLKGSNVLDGYRNLGYRTLGYGGVRWFRHETLQGMFDEFSYYPISDYISVFNERQQSEFPLNHIDEIVMCAASHEKFFVFINSPETHAPYDFGEGIYSKEISEIISKGKNIWGCKKGNTGDYQITSSEFRKLHHCQIAALEVIDSKIEDLVNRLPKPLLVIISGDHGECFGENQNWGHGFPDQMVMEVPLLIARV